MPEKPRDELKLRHWCIRKLLKGEDVETIQNVSVSRGSLLMFLEGGYEEAGVMLVWVKALTVLSRLALDRYCVIAEHG